MREDLRVIKNKNAIKTAFLNLLDNKDYNDITVSQICRNALVSRTTFYFHYENKEELLEFIYLDVMEEFSRLLLDSYKAPKTELKTHIRTAFEYMTKNSSVIKTFLKLDDHTIMANQKIRNTFITQFEEYAKEHPHLFKKDDYVHFYACLYGASAIETLYWWLNEGMKDNRYNEVENIIYDCLEKGMNKAFFK
ncbi:MAG: TetR/AcrR family transcriptional regulator [Erysipelotrichaceae bacterium]|nr:TetR/AcrR family transcriptional regulator [Erysipelotrichaceae bacterium]